MILAEFAPRPAVQRRGWPHAWASVKKMLLQTLTNGQAVAVPVNGRSPQAICWALRKWANKKGLSLRQSHEGGVVKVWLEEMPDEYLQREGEAP